jgi:hypothetical protein
MKNDHQPSKETTRKQRIKQEEWEADGTTRNKKNQKNYTTAGSSRYLSFASITGGPHDTRGYKKK